LSENCVPRRLGFSEDLKIRKPNGFHDASDFVNWDKSHVGFLDDFCLFNSYTPSFIISFNMGSFPQGFSTRFISCKEPGKLGQK
jgi:hypothetical protein